MSEQLSEDFTPKDLGSLLGGEESAVQAEETVTEEVQENLETKETESEVNTETESPQTDVENDSSSESDDTKSDIKVPLAALHAERDKRQGLQAELDALKANSEAQKPTEPKLPSIYDGEAEFENSLTDHVQKTVSQAIFNDRLKISQESVVKEHGEEVVQVALDKATKAMTNNPKLVERFRGSSQPFEEIMTMAKELDEAERFNNPDLVDKWKDEERKRIEAEVRAEIAGDAKIEADIDNSIPQSMSGARSSGTLKGTNFTGQKPLDSILNN